VTDDDVCALAIAAGSEREPIVGRGARKSSRAGTCIAARETLASRRERAPVIVAATHEAADPIEIRDLGFVSSR